MKPSNRSQCSHDPFGCGRGVDDAVFYRRAGLCNACARKASLELRVTVADLPAALSAHAAARAGRPYHKPTVEEVWAILDKMNALLPANLRVVQQDKHIEIPPPMRCAPADSCLPDGDRLEVAA